MELSIWRTEIGEKKVFRLGININWIELRERSHLCKSLWYLLYTLRSRFILKSLYSVWSKSLELLSNAVYETTRYEHRVDLTWSIHQHLTYLLSSCSAHKQSYSEKSMLNGWKRGLIFEQIFSLQLTTENHIIDFNCET